MTNGVNRELPDSAPTLPAAARPTGAQDPNEPITVSVYLKSVSAPPAADQEPEDLEALTTRRASEHASDVQALRDFAAQHGLTVEAVEPARRLVKLTGPAAQIQSAFGVGLSSYEIGGRSFRSHSGAVRLPDNLADRVEAVLGLDTRPIAQPRLKLAPQALTSHLPNQVGALYGFPKDVNGRGQCIALIELGGGYRAADNEAAFRAMGLAVPTILSVSVDGGSNTPGTPADGEVALDIQVAGGNAPGARIAVYFAPNTIQGFVDAITHAAADATNRPKAISISWGAPEVEWLMPGMTAMNAMNSAMIDAARVGVSVFVAAGDHLGTDGLADGKAHVDFPASSAWAIGCGGTQINTSGGVIVSEVVWNEGASGWGTGGGISDYFGVPGFQAKTPLPRSVNGGRVGRGVPDVAGDASGLTPYSIVLDGAATPIGGTSAVAPLWAGLTALLNESRGSSLGFFLPTLYASPTPMREIVSGNNKPEGSNLGYDAGPHWNACTGLGVPTKAIEAYFKPKLA
jgi:kumamolisin